MAPPGDNRARESKKRKVNPGRKLFPMAKRSRPDLEVVLPKICLVCGRRLPESSSTLHHHRRKASPEPASALNPLTAPPPVSASYQLKRKMKETVQMSEPIKKRHLCRQDEVRSPDLPNVLIHEIMVRLPARSVVKFQCASKTWFSIASSPFFIKAHLEHSRIARQTIVIADSSRKRRSKTRLYDANLDDDGIYLCELPLLKMLNKSFLAASCDGLILFRSLKRYYIINPLTGKFCILPRTPSDFNGFLGFYFHCPSSEYRLLAKNEDSETTYVNAVGKSDWRRIHDRRPALLTNFNSVDIGGSLYWLAFKEPLVQEDEYPHKTLPNTVMAFDKEAEVYSLLPIPPLKELKDRGGNLMNFNGELGLWFISDRGFVDFWIKKEGWIKRYSVYHPDLDLSVLNFPQSVAWMFGSAVSIKDEELLIAVSRQYQQQFLVHWNLKTGACLVEEVEDYSPNLVIQFPHIEALTIPGHSLLTCSRAPLDL